MSTLERELKQAQLETIKEVVSAGLISDFEALRKAFKLSKKAMAEILKSIPTEK